MRRFNPEKELYKIQHGNRNKIILFVISLLVVGIMGYSFALYQVRYSKRIIYTKVAPFSNKDIELAVYLDGVPSSNGDFPGKKSGYKYDHIECDNDSTAKFDTGTWQVILRAGTKDKCNVYFVKEEGIPNVPELYQGLIPIVYDGSGNIRVADTTTDWYNYDEKRWANAVLVSNTNYSKYVDTDAGEYLNNKTIPMGEILQMYVWIPRYKYQLFNAENAGIDPQEIQITFENGTESTGNVSCEIDNKGKERCKNDTNGNWYTHPAFTFGGTELTGIWVGKFEPSGSTSNLTILPNKRTLVSINLKTMFDASRSIEEDSATNFNLNKDEIDTHMMKNMEWGAVAYLTQSRYGRCDSDGICEKVAWNNVNETGQTLSYYTWITNNNGSTSTTGNLYGVYDITGPSSTLVMGVAINEDGDDINYSLSGFDVETKPDERYYDLYENDTVATSSERGHLGDASRETLATLGVATGAWYGRESSFVTNSTPWFGRGGAYLVDGTGATFGFGRVTAGGVYYHSFRVVLTAQDGDS